MGLHGTWIRQWSHNFCKKASYLCFVCIWFFFRVRFRTLSGGKGPRRIERSETRWTWSNHDLETKIGLRYIHILVSQKLNPLVVLSIYIYRVLADLAIHMAALLWPSFGRVGSFKRNKPMHIFSKGCCSSALIIISQCLIASKFLRDLIPKKPIEALSNHSP